MAELSSIVSTGSAKYIYIFSLTNAVSERKATEVSSTPKITEIESQKLRLRSEEKLFSIQWCINFKNKINPNRF